MTQNHGPGQPPRVGMPDGVPADVDTGEDTHWEVEERLTRSQRRIQLLLGLVWCGMLIAMLGAVDGEPAPFPFAQGEQVDHSGSESLKAWLPEPFWAHRRHFFYPGMEMRVGPAQRDYAPPAVYAEATAANAGRAQIGQDGTLDGYVSGQPFPMEQLDCAGDPEAGSKVIWNFVHRWQGFGARATFRYTYLDRGEVLPLKYEGTTSAYLLKHRPEPQFSSSNGDVFKDESRLMVVGFEVVSPSQAAGTRTLTYRYADSFGPLATAPPEDTWIYARQIRRVRKISQTARSNAVAGTDFSFDDLFTFSGLPAQYTWRCLGEDDVLAPMNTQRLGYPYEKSMDRVFGPSGLSYASDRWELRRAVKLEMVPKDHAHPYSRKDLWLDRQTLQPIYSFAYDRKGELWKIIQHNHRWSEDDLAEVKARDWYPGWEGVPEPRDLRIVSDSIFNAQTGTGNRLDFWDSHGSAPDLTELKRYIDIQRLRRGR